MAKLLFEEVYSDVAWSLYAAEVSSDEFVVAPALLRYEITNIARQRVRRALAAPAVADASLGILDGLKISYPEVPDMHRRALAAANQHNLSAAYDAHYLVLAEELGCDLWTDDRELLALVGGRLPFVRAIADYPTV